MKKRRTRSREDVKQGVIVGSTVTLATLGCSSCNDGGAVDPPPPPLICGDVEAGQTLGASATREGRTLTVVIRQESYTGWTETPDVSEVEGLTFLSAERTEFTDNVIIRFDIPSDTTSTGAFTLSGSLQGYPDVTCPVTRRFTVTIQGQIVDVAEASVPLPLNDRSRARIELIRQEGLRVLLRPTGASPEWKLVWSVTDGSLDLTPEGVLWTLPSAPGLYQAELLTDHGSKGFAVDTLPMEVV